MGKGEKSILTQALRGVSFEIHEGEFTSIIGQSGSGKSTLMHILGFLDSPTRGQYLLDGRDTSGFGEDELSDIRSQKIGFVFQAFNLLARTSAIDNVRLPLIYQGVGLSEQKRRAEEALNKVGLGNRLDHKPNELSGGQQQRVAIARALITNPRLILADEPTGNLDSKASLEIIELFKTLNREGRTIILVTHDPEVAEITHRIIQIKDGLIIADHQNGRTMEEPASVEPKIPRTSHPDIDFTFEAPNSETEATTISEEVPEEKNFQETATLQPEIPPPTLE